MLYRIEEIKHSPKFYTCSNVDDAISHYIRDMCAGPVMCGQTDFNFWVQANGGPEEKYSTTVKMSIETKTYKNDWDNQRK